jgi:hypothetical protein
MAWDDVAETPRQAGMIRGRGRGRSPKSRVIADIAEIGKGKSTTDKHG